MWMPRDPDVFGNPRIPCSSSTSLTVIATSRTVSKPTPSDGSRSTRSSSGRSRSARRTGHGFQSMLLRFVAHTRCAASTGTSSVALRPEGNVTVAVCSHSGGACTRFWKKNAPSTPWFQRLSTVGRSRTPSSTASEHVR